MTPISLLIISGQTRHILIKIFKKNEQKVFSRLKLRGQSLIKLLFSSNLYPIKFKKESKRQIFFFNIIKKSWRKKKKNTKKTI